jgi:hypothetical protein
MNCSVGADGGMYCSVGADGGMNCSVAGCGSGCSTGCCDCSIDGASYAPDVGSDEPELESDAGVSEDSAPGFVMLST